MRQAASEASRQTRDEETVTHAFQELEQAIVGSASEDAARAALEVLRRAFHNVRACATTDALTGLANRVCFYELLDKRLQAGLAAGNSAAVLFLDLDGFKVINDERGHAVGDALLAAVAARIACSVRDEDLVARHGGDEFVVLLENVENRSVAHAVAARVIESISAPFVHGDDIVQLGVSIGVAFYPEHGDSSSVLLQHADHAMYRAKSHGGRSYAVFGERDDLSSPRTPARSWAWELSPVRTDGAANDVAIIGREHKR